MFRKISREIWDVWLPYNCKPMDGMENIICNEFIQYRWDNIDRYLDFSFKSSCLLYQRIRTKRISRKKKKTNEEKKREQKNRLTIQITWPTDPTHPHNVPRNREERTTGITSCQAIRPENHVATKITMYERADRDMQMKTVTGRTNHTGISRDPNR